MSFISDLADAIQRQEGWFPGSASWRNNNPGNIMMPDGTTLRTYPDYATGRSALERDLTVKVNRGMSLSSMLNMYAPEYDSAGRRVNDTPAYIKNVSAWLGIPADVDLRVVEDNYAGPGTTADLGLPGDLSDVWDSVTAAASGVTASDRTFMNVALGVAVAAVAWGVFGDHS